MQPHDPHAERWLAQLRDGNAHQKAEARQQLAAIFATRGLPNDAIGLLVANAQAGFGSADQFQMLARLYHETGNEYLAASAAMEAARLRQGGLPPPPPPPGPAGQYQPPPPSPPSPPQRRAGTIGAYRRAVHQAAQGGHVPAAGFARVPGPPVPSVLGVPLTRPIRLLGWGAVVAVIVGAAAISLTSPLTSLSFVLAAGALALALTGPSSARRAARIPAGPLGDGALLLGGLLAFLIGGALAPRTSSMPVSPIVAPAATPGSLYAGTPTPSSRAAAPTAQSAAAGAPGAAGGSSPEPGAASSPGDTTGQRFVIAAKPAGITLRVSPGSTRGGVAAGDGTLVVAVAADRMTGGHAWRQVQTPDNERGWIEVDRLLPAPTDPLPSFPNGRPPSGRACTGGSTIKGYISSTGELIYHRTGSEHYYRTFPVVCFRTEDEARAAGFQPGHGSGGSSSSDPSSTPIAQSAPSGPDPPSAARSPTLTAQRADAGTRVRIVNAGNEGVRLRPSPGADEVLKILAEGTPLVLLGEEREDGGRQWRRVREQDGLEGWVAADFVAAMPLPPTAVAAAPTPTAPPTIRSAAVAPPVQPQSPATPQPPVPATAASKPQPAAPATAARKPQPVTPTLAPTARPTVAQAAPKAAPSGFDCPASHPIKGNHSSSGEWIYHSPRGQFYGRTRPEECFATEADASRAGYRPSQR